MKNKLTCEQIDALIYFYREGKLNENLAKIVKEHIESCPVCNEKYNKVSTNRQTVETVKDEKRYELFKNNLSAYIDNELDNTESIKIKKIAISNPIARQDLENIYSFKKLMYDTFEKTKNGMKDDFSQGIINQVKYGGHEAAIGSFYKLTAIFAAMILCILAGFFSLLHWL